MAPVIERVQQHVDDGLPRTDWFSPDTHPTVPGEYEARTGGGHIFRRKWTDHGWINSVTGLVSKAPIEWRGVLPGEAQLKHYSLGMQHNLTGVPFA